MMERKKQEKGEIKIKDNHKQPIFTRDKIDAEAGRRSQYKKTKVKALIIDKKQVGIRSSRNLKIQRKGDENEQ